MTSDLAIHDSEFHNRSQRHGNGWVPSGRHVEVQDLQLELKWMLAGRVPHVNRGSPFARSVVDMRLDASPGEPFRLVMLWAERAAALGDWKLLGVEVPRPSNPRPWALERADQFAAR